jgi:exopolyphosphatase/guanosine-5'-triphosphate,3'-diphosphate pyrophosphatase
MILAAIDIGSNGIRLQVIRVLDDQGRISFKNLEYIRFPLRLGKDVFEKGAIRKKTIRKFESLMKIFYDMIQLYEAEGYMATATSAMREATNGKEIVEKVQKDLGLEIEIISGDLEAQLLSYAIIPYLNDQTYVHVDVGGGSTELTVYVQKDRMNSRSFNIGSVRHLNRTDKSNTLREIDTWLENEIQKLKRPIIIVGTGGNIKKLYQLSNRRNNRIISLAELMGIKAYVAEFDTQQRINHLRLNPDRADVIIPAANIYLHIAKLVKADQILVPSVGLKDGLIYQLYSKFAKVDIRDIEFVNLFEE